MYAFGVLPGLRSPLPWHGTTSGGSSNIPSFINSYCNVRNDRVCVLAYLARVEDATNHGRIDMAVILPENIYLFEFKVVELLPDGKALQQLQDKAYADKYRSLGLPIHLIGVEFSREAHNVVGFEVAS